jgi:eukaryotic-like serine/threonine-protein kinase
VAEPDLREQLRSSLSDSYDIERELGGGGMARVFVARDAALKREIVIKVLSPDLAGGVSLDRFRREIELAAGLQHPNIVPVLAAGEAAGLPYYTMPFVAGESLRERVSRGALPVRDALSVLRDVARALAYAHSRGVVHRDIKPDNVLLSHDYAVVTDFGVAKAISAARSQSDADSAALTLTALGVSLGTPAYMAPEQAAGDPATDHRADIYAFGVVAYEILTGALPFDARTAQAMLVAHATQKPIPLGAKRTDVPVSLGLLVMRCLEKEPDKRPSSADDLVRALDETLAGEMRAASARPSSVRRRRVAIAAATTVVAAIVATSLRPHKAPAVNVDPNTVVVLPFRVTATDTAIKSLHEGIVDLIAAKLTGAIHTADTRRVLAEWRKAGGASDASKDVAGDVMRRVGAGLAIDGDVTQAGSSVTLSASLIDARLPGAKVKQSVTGPPDAVAMLVDSLVGKLLAERAAGPSSRLESIPLLALQEYIAGKAAYRRGHYREAGDHFARAIGIDSTFALAGLHLWLSAGWSLDARGDQGHALAFAHRDQLGAMDRLLLHEAPDGQVGCAARLSREEDATRTAPDIPELWYDLGDELTHCGAAMGLDDSPQRALAAFNRALALDSTFTPALEHLPMVYLWVGDTAAGRRALSYFPDTSDFLPINQYLVLTDSAARAHTMPRLLTQSLPTLLIGAYFAAGVFEPPGIADAERMLSAARARAATEADRRAIATSDHLVALMLGQPKRAIASGTAAGLEPADFLLERVFWDGDSSAAASALPAAVSFASRPPTASNEAAWVTSAFATAEYGFAVKGPTDADARGAAQLRAFKGSVFQASRAQRFALLLDAQHAAATDAPNAMELVTRVDSMLRRVEGGRYNETAGNLIAARLWERMGDLRRAYGATLRMELRTTPRPFVSTMWRERGRLAAAAGDTTNAIRAYRQYVAIRAQAEPSLRPDLENAKRELARLEKRPAGR